MESPDTGEVATYATSGYLAMLRPKDFKLLLYGRMMQTVADIGSNADRFWFWLDSQQAEKADRHVYYCDYADLPTANLAGTYQPDWIVDALGLKTITPDDAAVVRVAPGPRPETTKLSFPAIGAGSAYAREMIVSDASRRLVEYRVFDRDGKTPIGRAAIKEYSNVELEAVEAGADTESTESRECYIANRIVLEWKKEQISLDILLKDFAVNQTFSARMKANFVEPTPRGYTPLDLAEASRELERTQGESTAVRETLPAPEPRSRARLGPTVEIQGAEPTDSETRSSSRTRAISAPKRIRPPTRRGEPKPDATLGPLLMPGLDDVVGAAPPGPPGTPYQTTDAAGYFTPAPMLAR
jgi:hypothetical protein